MSSWLTEQEAADMLRVSLRALKRARYEGKIRAKKVLGVVQYHEDWIEDFRNGCKDNEAWQDTPKAQNSQKSKAPHTGILSDCQGNLDAAKAQGRQLGKQLMQSLKGLDISLVSSSARQTVSPSRKS